MSHGGRRETQFSSCFQVTGITQELLSMELETTKISWILGVQTSLGLFFSSEGCIAKRIIYVVPCICIYVIWLDTYIIPWELNNFHEIFNICSSYLEQKLWLKVKNERQRLCTRTENSIQIFYIYRWNYSIIHLWYHIKHQSEVHEYWSTFYPNLPVIL